MPRPDRLNQQQGGAPRPQQQMPPGQPMQQQPMPMPMQSSPMASGGIREDIRALNSSILLVTQKIKYLVRNEKILGRNLVVLNKKIKTLEDKIVNPQAQEDTTSASSAEVTSLKQRVELLEAQLEDYRSRTASKEELGEVKYIINSINPLEFATLSQVRDLIDKKMAEKKK